MCPIWGLNPELITVTQAIHGILPRNCSGSYVVTRVNDCATWLLVVAAVESLANDVSAFA
ncbi:unannotated protein [freshwater metagenome]|uniref:Unannotated protein n=1 Tax=freshwater metagenome TaxID=449393 RepID=A0A6J7LZR1_9ZZZZ